VLRRLTRGARVHSPMLSQMRKGLNELLHDVVTLEIALSRKTEAHVLVRPCVALCAPGG
jgi:hypothetical protein